MQIPRSIFILALLPALYHPRPVAAQKLLTTVSIDASFPQGGFADGSSGGFGPVGGLEYAFGRHFGATFDLGYVFLAPHDDSRAVFDGGGMVPLQLGWKFYLQENYTGFYIHTQVGAHGVFLNDPPDTVDDGAPWHSSFGLGVGWLLDRIDLTTRSVFLSTNNKHDTDAPSWSYFGVHVGYRLTGD